MGLELRSAAAGYRLVRWLSRIRPLRAAAERLFLIPRRRARIARLARVLPVPPLRAGTAGGAPIVLILAFRPWPVHRAWETVFARLLAAEGARPIWVECDEAVLRCDAMSERPDAGICRYCRGLNRACDGAAGVERVSLRDWCDRSPSALAALRADAAAAGASHAEVPLVRTSFQRLLGKRNRPTDPLGAAERRILEELLVSAELVRRAAPRLLEALRPRGIVTLNGKFFAEAIFIEEAARRGIAVCSYERGVRPDTLFVGAGAAIPYPMDDAISELEARPLSTEEDVRIRSLLAARAEASALRTRGAPQALLRRATARAPGERLLALFTNVIWDSAVVGEDTVFEDMFDWILFTVDVLRTDPAARLVIRVHPAEEEVYWHATRDKSAEVIPSLFSGGLPESVTLIDPAAPLDSYMLMQSADAVLVYASTVGMEAAALGKRVVTAARSHYHTAPFVTRALSREHYREELLRPSATPARSDSAELARRYLYRLYFERMLAVPLVRAGRSGFRVEPARLDGAGLEPLRRRLRDLLLR